MDKREYLTEQENINSIWSAVWKKMSIDYKGVFHQRIFLEGYSIVKKYIPSSALDILEIGGGTGRYGLKIAQDFPHARVVITDIVDESLVFIKEVSKNLNLKNVEVKKEDVLGLSYPNNSFDLIFSDAVIQHLPQDGQAVAEMVRVLRPGGKIIVAVVNKWNFHSIFKSLFRSRYEYGYEKSYTEKELRKIFEANNLKVEDLDGFYVGYGIFRLKKYHSIFKFLGKLINRISKILDRFTNRFFSRKFGFEILVVGTKR